MLGDFVLNWKVLRNAFQYRFMRSAIDVILTLMLNREIQFYWKTREEFILVTFSGRVLNDSVWKSSQVLTSSLKHVSFIICNKCSFSQQIVPQNLWTGLSCTTTSQTDPLPRLGANWRPWHWKLKLSLFQKVAYTAEVVIHDVSASGPSYTRLADFLPPWQEKKGWDIVVQPYPGPHSNISSVGMLWRDWPSLDKCDQCCSVYRYCSSFTQKGQCKPAFEKGLPGHKRFKELQTFWTKLCCPSQLLFHIKQNNLWHVSKADYRPHHSTETAFLWPVS